MYPIQKFDSIPSTNIVAREMAEEGAVHGTTVVAATQTAGRGRLGKKWHSSTGRGLYCSIIIRPENIAPQDYPKITLVAGLAVASAIDQFTGKLAQLKWPNDIYYSGKKCAGILAESSAMNAPPALRYAIVGIGINVANTIQDFPPELRSTVTSILLEKGEFPPLDQVLNRVHSELLKKTEVFELKGFSEILEKWKKRDFLIGKIMECVSTEGRIVTGEALGPDEQGQLHVRDGEGNIHTVLSGDVRLALKK